MNNKYFTPSKSSDMKSRFEPFSPQMKGSSLPLCPETRDDRISKDCFTVAQTIEEFYLRASQQQIVDDLEYD